MYQNIISQPSDTAPSWTLRLNWAESHLSISPLHRSHGCSRSWCWGQQHSGSNWTHVQSTGRAAARSPPCLHRIPQQEIQLSRSPAPSTPHRPPAHPSRGCKQSPTGHGGAPQLCQNTCYPHQQVWPHLWIRGTIRNRKCRNGWECSRFL